jgi:uncharacterized peroxidase-related enzyme
MNSEYKLTLPLRNLEDAEPAVRASLERAKKATGFIPNMYAGMANSPGMLDTYLDGYARFRKDSGFTPVEQEVVLLTISQGNACEYCIAAHSFMAEQVSKVPAPVIEAIRNDRPIADPRLAALNEMTATLLSTRGLPKITDVQAFLRAGYEERQLFEIILAIAVKTLSNYANHLLHTPLDAMFADRAWRKSA